MNKLYSGPGLEVIDPLPPYLNTTGMVRWNGTSQQLECATNNPDSYSVQWHPLPVYGETHIRFSPPYENAIQWAMAKMNEEAKLKELCAKHPGLKDIKEKYEVMLALVRENDDRQ